MNGLAKIIGLISLFGMFGISIAHGQVVDTTMAGKLRPLADSAVKPIIKKPALAEADTTKPADTTQQADTTKKKDRKTRKPSGAAIRSAILPGWGQVYNRKIWKVPIVYAALGSTAGLFIYNLQWYKRTRYAYTVAYNIQQGNDEVGSESYNKVYKDLKIPFFEGQGGVQPETLRRYRDDFRKTVDYSAVYFLIAWALNVVDATVDAHLSDFDISPDLSFKIQPGYSELAGTNGVSLVLRIK